MGQAKGAWSIRIIEQSPCMHLGQPTGQVIPCQSCNQQTAVKIHACSIHGECTRGILLSGFPCCRICEQKEVAGG